MAEKFIESLEKAKRSLQTADHMTYVTFPLVKEKRLLLKILEELSLATISIVNAILQYEYYYKRIQLYSDAKENFNIFRDKCSIRYNIDEKQIEKIMEILKLGEKHKKSPFEFVKQEKIVIMSNGLRTDTITVDRIKGFIIEIKDLLRKANLTINK